MFDEFPRLKRCKVKLESHGIIWSSQPPPAEVTVADPPSTRRESTAFFDSRQTTMFFQFENVHIIGESILRSEELCPMPSRTIPALFAWKHHPSACVFAIVQIACIMYIESAEFCSVDVCKVFSLANRFLKYSAQCTQFCFLRGLGPTTSAGV